MQGGHTTESYSEPLYLGMLLGGIRYALAKGADLPVATPPLLLRPVIKTLKLSVRTRRIQASFRVTNCSPCVASLVVRSKTVKLRIAKGNATGASAVLPAGRWPVRIVVTDSDSGKSRTVRRTLRVR